MKTYILIWVLLIASFGLFSAANCSNDKVDQLPRGLIENQPALTGRLVFHNYTCYSCNDSKLFLYDFRTNSLAEISNSWGISNPMNAHFSPDGKSIVFMGITPGSGWDVFRWRIGTTVNPQNLTRLFGNKRDEDPKYSFDGNKIVFKQNGIIKEMDTLGNIFHTINVPNTEASMPFFTIGNNSIVYSGNEAVGNTADILIFSSATNTVLPLSANIGVEEYYPIVRDDTSFLFTKWSSTTDHNDQVFLGFFNGRLALRLPFNEIGYNFSDAYPINNKYVVLSSTKSGGSGGYDLYIADLINGKKWSLYLYNKNINTTKEELGAAYIE